MELLFSYGTLQLKSVQMANFGRELTGHADTLIGYQLDFIEMTDERVLAESGQSHHPIVRYTGRASDQVDGTVFELTPAELARADDYEVSDYRRVSAALLSGQVCWVYVAAGQEAKQAQEV